MAACGGRPQSQAVASAAFHPWGINILGGGKGGRGKHITATHQLCWPHLAGYTYVADSLPEGSEPSVEGLGIPHKIRHNQTKEEEEQGAPEAGPTSSRDTVLGLCRHFLSTLAIARRRVQLDCR